MHTITRRVVGALMLAAGVAGHLSAAISAPEIDPASGATALTLLAGGLLVLRGRRK